MKDHIKESRYIYPTGSVDVVIADIQAKAADLVDPMIECEYGWDDREYIITGWRPMTEKELEQAKQQRKREREAKKAAKAKAEAAEREAYEKLKAKYG